MSQAVVEKMNNDAWRNFLEPKPLFRILLSATRANEIGKLFCCIFALQFSRFNIFRRIIVAPNSSFRLSLDSCSGNNLYCFFSVYYFYFDFSFNIEKSEILATKDTNTADSMRIPEMLKHHRQKDACRGC